MDEQWHVNSNRWIVNFSLLTQIFEESSVEFKGLKFESLGHIIGVFWGIFRRVQISEIWESRPYYWCQKEPIKRNQRDHFFRSIVFLCQMRAIIGNLQKYHIGGKHAFSSGKYWSVLAVVQVRQIGESKSFTKSGVSWNSSGFSAPYSLKTLKHFGLCASQENKRITFISETWQEFFW